ncbi:hypothetical protein GBA52_008922, partial [Prunus armeniaca]
HLCFRLSCLEKNDLVMLLKECRELVLLDVRECEGFDERDEEILKLVSHIRCWKPNLIFTVLHLLICSDAAWFVAPRRLHSLSVSERSSCSIKPILHCFLPMAQRRR